MEEPIVKTRSGAVRGSYEKGVATFKGIPFELARQVHRTWITFATTGNPG